MQKVSTAPAEAGAGLAVEVVYGAAPHQVDQVRLRLPAGATVADALQASGVLQRHGLTLGAGGVSVAVWGRSCGPGQVLREQDRVEVLRPLQVDPKEARRQRYRKAGKAGRSGKRSRAAGPVSGSSTR